MRGVESSKENGEFGLFTERDLVGGYRLDYCMRLEIQIWGFLFRDSS